MSTWTSPHSAVGISASRRSISASPGEYISVTAAAPRARSPSIERATRGIVAAPQSEALGVGEVVQCGGASRRDIDHAGIRQGMLETQSCAPLLRGCLIPPLAFAADRVLHGVALVENDHSVEVGAQPFDDLPDARKLLTTLIGTQRSVGRKKDTFRQPDRRALVKARQRRNEQPLHPERGPVALRI